MSRMRGPGRFMVERSGGADVTALSGPSGIVPSLLQRAVQRDINLRPCTVKVLQGYQFSSPGHRLSQILQVKKNRPSQPVRGRSRVHYITRHTITMDDPFLHRGQQYYKIRDLVYRDRSRLQELIISPNCQKRNLS